MQCGSLQTTVCPYYDRWLDVKTFKAWVVDLILKTNQYNIPLFGFVCCNKEGIGMHVFWCYTPMIRNERTALQLTMKNILRVLEDVYFNAIAIDKNKT